MSAQVEQKNSGWLEIVGVVYAFALFSPWFPPPVDVQKALEIDIALFLAPIAALIAWFIWLGVSLRSQASAQQEFLKKLPPHEREFVEASLRRQAEIDAKYWNFAKERVFSATYAEKIKENAYMHINQRRRIGI